MFTHRGHFSKNVQNDLYNIVIYTESDTESDKRIQNNISKYKTHRQYTIAFPQIRKFRKSCWHFKNTYFQKKISLNWSVFRADLFGIIYIWYLLYNLYIYIYFWRYAYPHQPFEYWWWNLVQKGSKKQNFYQHRTKMGPTSTTNDPNLAQGGRGNRKLINIWK